MIVPPGKTFLLFRRLIKLVIKNTSKFQEALDRGCGIHSIDTKI